VMFLAEEGRKALVRRFEAKRLTRRAKISAPPTREGDRGSGNVLRREESVQSRPEAGGHRVRFLRDARPSLRAKRE